MRAGLRFGIVVLGAILTASMSSSCALSKLKEKNQWLTEANGRLANKKTELERQVAEYERSIEDKDREISELRDRLGSVGDVGRGREVAMTTSSADDFGGLGVESERTDRGTLVRLDHAVFFPLGRASLSSEGKRILQSVSRVLNSKYGANVIRVEGHTDDTPIRRVKDKYPTNWELSAARACSVVRYLVQSGSINPSRIYPAGFAYFRPRDGAGRSKNRRVEILILDERA